MSSTANLDLPLIQQGQAQKHVTVNEALSVLDTVAQLTLESLAVVTPPETAAEGQGWAVPTGATGAWSGADGHVAIMSNGGWRFVSPRAGWRAFAKDEGRAYLHDGWTWNPDAVAVSWYGAGVAIQVKEFEHSVSGGTSNATIPAIPSHCIVFGITGRVVADISGSLTGWTLGVADSPSRYGTGLRLAAGAWVYGLTGQPLSYFEETPLVLSAENGTFSGGHLRLAVHLLRLGVPRQ